MWQYETVERALFQWHKWRRSILGEWIALSELEELPLRQLKFKAREELNKLNLPRSLWLELYWICCVSSECNFDYEASFKNILVPAWLPLPYDPSLSDYQIELGTRMYPPPIWDEGDMQFHARRMGLWGLANRKLLYPKEYEFRIFLPSHHELYDVLNRLKGRPKRSDKSGKHPSHSDRLAVKCATLRDRYLVKNVEVAKRFGFPVKKPYSSLQSNHVMHLIRRGRKLISELQ